MTKNLSVGAHVVAIQQSYFQVGTCSSFRKGSQGIVCDKRNICSPSVRGRKCTTTATPTGSARISERKREQNRFAAVRYRGI